MAEDGHGTQQQADQLAQKNAFPNSAAKKTKKNPFKTDKDMNECIVEIWRRISWGKLQLICKYI